MKHLLGIAGLGREGIDEIDAVTIQGVAGEGSA